MICDNLPDKKKDNRKRQLFYSIFSLVFLSVNKLIGLGSQNKRNGLE